MLSRLAASRRCRVAALGGCDCVRHARTGRGDAIEANATVERAVDGDTLVVDADGVSEKVRLIGIDTPESVEAGIAGGVLRQGGLAPHRRAAARTAPPCGSSATSRPGTATTDCSPTSTGPRTACSSTSRWSPTATPSSTPSRPTSPTPSELSAGRPPARRASGCGPLRRRRPVRLTLRRRPPSQAVDQAAGAQPARCRSRSSRHPTSMTPRARTVARSSESRVSSVVVVDPSRPVGGERPQLGVVGRRVQEDLGHAGPHVHRAPSRSCARLPTPLYVRRGGRGDDALLGGEVAEREADGAWVEATGQPDRQRELDRQVEVDVEELGPQLQRAHVASRGG